MLPATRSAPTALGTLSVNADVPHLAKFDTALQKFTPVLVDNLVAHNVKTHRVAGDVHSVLFQASAFGRNHTYRFQDLGRNLVHDHPGLGDGKTEFNLWIEDDYNFNVLMMQEAPTLDSITMKTGQERLR